MENTDKQGPTIGQSTGNLLLALRALATAQTHYFAAHQPGPAEQLEHAAAAFGDVRAIIEQDITAAVSGWANNPTSTAI